MLLAALLFSSMEIAIKLSGGVFHPIQLNLLRFFIGGLLLLPLAHRQNRHLPILLGKRDYQTFALTGFMCVVLAMTLYVLSLTFSKASVVAVLFSGNAFFAIILAAFILQQKIGHATAWGLTCCLAGLALIINPLKMSDSAVGIALALLSALFFAMYSNSVKYHQRQSLYRGILPTAYTFLFGSAELFVLVAITHIPQVSAFLSSHNLALWANIPIIQGVTFESLPLLIYIAVFVSGVGFAAHALAIEHGSVVVGSLAFFIKPVLSPILSYWFLSETQPSLAILGIVVVAIGSVVIVLESAGFFAKRGRLAHSLALRNHVFHK